MIGCGGRSYTHARPEKRAQEEDDHGRERVAKQGSRLGITVNKGILRMAVSAPLKASCVVASSLAN